MPLILGTNSIKDTGYDVANSLRFDDGSSDHLNRTPSSAGSRTTWTWSAWVKRSDIAPTNGLFEAYDSSGNFTYIRFAPDYLRILNIIGGSLKAQFNTSALFRDVSAWYHIVWTWDTTNGTAGDRSRLYVNGTRITDFSTETNPTSGEQSFINNNDAHYVGSTGQPSLYFNGYMAEVCLIDGQALDPTSFGEFDEDTGIWKPIDVSGLTFGTNGFYLDFENSGSLGADVSGNGNNFTVNNLTAIDQSTDTCTNNFATLNPLDYWSGSTASLSSFLSEGNLDYNVGSSAKSLVRSTIGVTSGKWYWEIKANSVSKGFYGMINKLGFDTSSSPHDSTNKAGVFYYDGTTQFRYYSGAGELSTGAVSISAGDILNFALDMDNKAFYVGKNGTWMNSGDPTSGALKTGAVNEIFPNSTAWSDYGEVFPAMYCSSVTGSIDASTNFGNGSFTISSGNSDGNGYGNFEYSVPSGYYALNTKNLAEYG